MPLTPGSRLGPYEILSPIGAGGMGEVYKAKDTRLDRTVAIKVLPEDLAHDEQFRERFEREARVVSALNHPHICTLHDIGHDGGIDFLVMEYIDGETLADRLRRGPLPLDEVLRYGSQIADALDKAHTSRIVHRDLKPGNVILSESGAKLLDFGLATHTPLRRSLSGDGSSLPTEARPLTAEGAVLGTLQYMAPEQLEGKEADARTDIFALGAVLYEMVTGQKALREALPDSGALPNTPPLLDHVIRRCLAKDPQKRWQAASDVMLELKFIADGGDSAAPVALPSRRRERLAWGVAAFGLLGAFVAFVLPPSRAPSPVRRLTLAPSAGEEFVFTGVGGFFGALSPDGRYLVYRAVRDGIRQLWLRPMDRFEATPIPGTEGAGPSFFSPDGQWIGFDTGAEIKKVSIKGGGAQSLVSGPWSVAGASWTHEDTIIFGTRNSGLWRIPADGGEAEPLTALDPASDATGHVWPEALPNGKGVLFAVTTGEARSGKNQLAVLSLESGEWRLLGAGTQPRLSPTGHIVFARDETLWAAPFDRERLELTGTPTPVLQGVMVNRGHGTAHYTMARDGTLVYLTASADDAGLLARVDRSGGVSPILSDGSYSTPRFSPDGTRLAFAYDTEDGQHIWLLDLSRGTRQRLSVDGELNAAPVWTPDGTRIAYRLTLSGKNHVFWKRTDGSSAAELLLTVDRDRSLTPHAFSPDGNALLLTEASRGQNDIVVLPVNGDRTPTVLLATAFDELQPALSPDGRWLAYVSNESGRYEVYVQDYPEPAGKTVVSTDGGSEPAWSSDGTELFYRNGDRVMAVNMSAHSPGKPEVLFEGPFVGASSESAAREYDVSRDGRHFVMVRRGDSAQFNVVLNFLDELEERVQSR